MKTLWEFTSFWWDRQLWVELPLGPHSSPSYTHFGHSLLPLTFTAAPCIAVWKFTQCYVFIWSHFFPVGFCPAIFCCDLLPLFNPVCSLRIQGHSPKRYAWFIYHSQRSLRDTYFIANVGWLNFFISIDRYWCLITGYSKGDCITSLQVSFDSDIMKLMQQTSFNTAYTHAVNYKEKFQRTPLRSMKPKSNIRNSISLWLPFLVENAQSFPLLGSQLLCFCSVVSLCSLCLSTLVMVQEIRYVTCNNF